MKITVEVEVPDGPTCLCESGYFCPWELRHTGSGQRWCRLFDGKDVPIENVRITDLRKCPACSEACKK